MRQSFERAASEVQLTRFQEECIWIFVQAADVMAIPKSVGEIYGLLFSSKEPLCFEAVATKLQMSKGAASQGIRWLRSIRAIEPTYVGGDRREFFTAQPQLRQLLHGLFSDRLGPRLRDSERNLARLEAVIQNETDGEETAFAMAQLGRLRRWSGTLRRVLPLLLRLLHEK